MLIIPLDGPPLDSHDAVVLTRTGLMRGRVVAETATHVHLDVDGTVHAIDRKDIRTIVTA